MICKLNLKLSKDQSPCKIFTESQVSLHKIVLVKIVDRCCMYSTLYECQGEKTAFTFHGSHTARFLVPPCACVQVTKIDVTKIPIHVNSQTGGLNSQDITLSPIFRFKKKNPDINNVQQRKNPYYLQYIGPTFCSSQPQRRCIMKKSAELYQMLCKLFVYTTMLL